MRKMISCLLFIAAGVVCFYFAFQEGTNAALGIPLTIVGALSLGLGIYKSWRDGILKSLLDFLLDFLVWL